MIRTIIIDDELPAISYLRNLLLRSGLVEIIGEFTKPSLAIEFARIKPIDVIFLDIEMPEMSGIEAADKLMDIQKELHIVFVTAFNSYAVEAFSLNALDYLVKPVTYERAMESLNRFRGEHQSVTRKNTGIEVTCFGRFAIYTDNQEIEFRTKKAEELFAFFIDQKGDFVSRSQVVDALWPDFEGDRARINFNTTLHYVKKAVGSAVPGPLFDAHRGRYRIILDHVKADCLHMNATEHIIHNPKKTDRSLILKAIESYTGGYLEANDYPWTYFSAIRYQELYGKLVIAGAKGYEKTTQGRELAIPLLKKALIHIPFDENVNYLLISLLLEQGDRVSAKNYFEIYERLLYKQYDTSSDPKFFHLFD